MTKFYILAPEIFLFLGICFSLLLGVFIKNSYNLILKISLLLLIITAILIFNSDTETVKVFSNTFIKDSFSNFIKLLIVGSCFFVLISSQQYVKEKKYQNLNTQS